MLIPFLLGFVGMVLVQGDRMNLTSHGCLDQPGFLRCQDSLTGHPDFCAFREMEMNCFTTYCWNNVYQCQYQQYAIDYLGHCSSVDPVPFFPAPSNVSNDCSCNLGNTYLSIEGMISMGNSCVEEVAKEKKPGMTKMEVSFNIVKGEHCKCCQVSGSFASLDAICPSTNPLDIGFKYIEQMSENLSLDFLMCQQYISNGNCITELHFPESLDGASKPLSYLNASDLTSFTQSNTAAVTNNIGTVQSLPGANTWTWRGNPESLVHHEAGFVKMTVPTYTVTAVTAPPSSVDAAVTKIEEVSPAPTMAPTYTLDLNRLINGGATEKEMRTNILAVSFTLAFFFGLHGLI